MATRLTREEERGEKRSVGEQVGVVQSYGLAWKGKGESKSTLIYGNPLGLELANSDRLALIAAFPLSLPLSTPPPSRPLSPTCISLVVVAWLPMKFHVFHAGRL